MNNKEFLRVYINKCCFITWHGRLFEEIHLVPSEGKDISKLKLFVVQVLNNLIIFYKMLSTVKSCEILPKDNCSVLNLEFLPLNWYILSTITNKKLLKSLGKISFVFH